MSRAKSEWKTVGQRGARRSGRLMLSVLAIGLGVVLALSITLCFVSCAEVSPDPLAFQKESFSAELRGSRRTPGKEGTSSFVAKIEVRREETTYALRVTYLAPEAMEGCEVYALCTVSGELTGEAELRFGELCITTPAQHLSGLLLPATALVAPRQLESIQKTTEGWRADYMDEVELLSAPDGKPIRFSSPEISFEVVWFDCRGVQ